MTIEELTRDEAIAELRQVILTQAELLRIGHGLLSELGVMERDDKYRKAFLKFDAACRRCKALGPGK